MHRTIQLFALAFLIAVTWRLRPRKRRAVSSPVLPLTAQALFIERMRRAGFCYWPEAFHIPLMNTIEIDDLIFVGIPPELTLLPEVRKVKGWDRCHDNGFFIYIAAALEEGEADRQEKWKPWYLATVCCPDCLRIINVQEDSRSLSLRARRLLAFFESRGSLEPMLRALSA